MPTIILHLVMINGYIFVYSLASIASTPNYNFSYYEEDVCNCDSPHKMVISFNLFYILCLTGYLWKWIISKCSEKILLSWESLGNWFLVCMNAFARFCHHNTLLFLPYFAWSLLRAWHSCFSHSCHAFNLITSLVNYIFVSY